MNDKSIRDRLLDMEKRNPDLEERFKKEMKKMLEKKLTPFGKIVWALASLFSAAMLIRFSYIAVVSQNLPWLVRIGFIEGAVFCAAWVALGIWILKKGSMNLVQHANAIHVIVFLFVLLLLINMQILGSQHADKTRGIQMMLSGAIFFLVFGIPAIFNLRINRTEASLREQLLKIELKIAELADKIK